MRTAVQITSADAYDRPVGLPVKGQQELFTA